MNVSPSPRCRSFASLPLPSWPSLVSSSFHVWAVPSQGRRQIPVRDGSRGLGGGAVEPHNGATDLDERRREEVDWAAREKAHGTVASRHARASGATVHGRPCTSRKVKTTATIDVCTGSFCKEDTCALCRTTCDASKYGIKSTSV
jgi:hypothetical protein